MTHLHEFIEQDRKTSSEQPYDDVLTQAVCFQMPRLYDLDGIRYQPELVRLPYAGCWLEGLAPVDLRGGGIVKNEEKVMGFLALQSTQEEIEFWGFVRVPEGVPNGHSLWRRGPRLKWKNLSWLWDSTDGWVTGGGYAEPNSYAGWLGAFLTLLNCANIQRQEHLPSPKLQKARARRNKLPLYSYWTLDLNFAAKGQREGARGGTHASPRLHLRRGHSRQYAKGQWCWVTPHAVGNKKLGVVHKEYAMARVPEKSEQGIGVRAP